jgi:ankyrin repeat protein
LATELDNIETAEVLLEHGASCTILNLEGKTPVELVSPHNADMIATYSKYITGPTPPSTDTGVLL